MISHCSPVSMLFTPGRDRLARSFSTSTCCVSMNTPATTATFACFLAFMPRFVSLRFPVSLHYPLSNKDLNTAETIDSVGSIDAAQPAVTSNTTRRHQTSIA